MKRIRIIIPVLVFLGLGFTAQAQTNVALGKDVTMFSVNGEMEGHYAVDGDPKYNLETGRGGTKTQGGQYQWIQVDLGASYTLDKVKIIQDSDWHKHVKSEYLKITGLIIAVSDDPNFKGVYQPRECSTYGIKYIGANSGTGSHITAINGSLTGRYVRLWDTDIDGIAVTEFEVYGKLSAGAAHAAIKDGSSEEAQAIAKEQLRQGTANSAELLQMAIDRNDSGLVKAIIEEDRKVPSTVFHSALQRNVSKDVIQELMSGDVTYTTSIVSLLINKKEDVIVKTVLQENKSLFTQSHVEKAYNSGQKDLSFAIMKGAGLSATSSMLTTALNKNDNVGAQKLIKEHGAQATTTMLNDAIRKENDDLIQTMFIHGKVVPDSESYVVAARTGNVDVYEKIVEKKSLTDNKSIEVAIDKGNKDILGKGLKNGGNVNEAFTYAISKNKKDIVSHLLPWGKNGLDVNPAIPFAVKQNDKNLFTTVLNEYNGDADLALKHSFEAKKFDLSMLALETGRVNTTSQYLAPAIDANEFAMAKKLVENGADAQQGLIAAIKKDKADLVQYLLEMGATTNGNGVMSNAGGRSIALLKVLVENDGDPSAAINTAALANKMSNVEYLLNQGADPEQGIVSACTYGYDSIVSLLLDNGATANKGIGEAVKGNHVSTAKILFNNGAGVAESYIQHAAMRDRVEMVSLLIQNGSNPQDGVVLAVEKDAARVFNVLVDNGANANDPALMKTAVLKGCINVLPALAQQGIDMNAQDPVTNESYLHLAANKGKDENMAVALIQAGTDPDLRNNKGESVLHVCARKGGSHLKMLQAIANAGADINARDNAGKTPRKVAKSLKVKNAIKALGGEK